MTEVKNMVDKNFNFAEVIKRRLISKKDEEKPFNNITNMSDPTFSVGEPVLIVFEGKCSAGIVMDVKHTFNWRKAKYCWGYEIDFKAEKIGPACTHIPEDYIEEVRDYRERIPKRGGHHMFK